MRRTDCFSVASRGRDPQNPGNRETVGMKLDQRLEVNWSGRSNVITHVSKDNYILEVFDEEIQDSEAH